MPDGTRRNEIAQYLLTGTRICFAIIAIISAPAALSQESIFPQVRCGQTPVELRGRVAVREGISNSGITITAFDGFEMKIGSTNPDGSYCLPIARSTSETYLAVFATREKFMPDLKIIRIPSYRQKPNPAGAKMVVEVPEMKLEPMVHPGQAGILIGICYSSIQGGRLTYRSGIDFLVPGLEVHIDGVTRGGESLHERAVCDSNGALRPTGGVTLSAGEVPEGTYVLSTAGRRNLGKFVIHSGSTEIRNVIDMAALID